MPELRQLAEAVEERVRSPRSGQGELDDDERDVRAQAVRILAHVEAVSTGRSLAWPAHSRRGPPHTARAVWQLSSACHRSACPLAATCPAVAVSTLKMWRRHEMRRAPIPLPGQARVPSRVSSTLPSAARGWLPCWLNGTTVRCRCRSRGAPSRGCAVVSRVRVRREPRGLLGRRGVGQARCPSTWNRWWPGG